MGDARALLAARRWSGAYYLTGYAVECALKACIARQTRRHEFPDARKVNQSYTHDLDHLVRVAGMQPALHLEGARDPVFQRYWLLTKDWSEQSRYRQFSESVARELYLAVSDLEHGVLQWVSRFW
jgi:hypothetical protein